MEFSTLLVILLKVVATVTSVFAALYYAFKNRPANREDVDRFFQEFRVGGHRGSPLMAPENTIVSMKQAKAEGADLVEFDVSLTKDGVPVLLHDDTLDRTTNCTGLVREKLFADLRSNCNAAARFKSASPNSPDNVPLPTLEELVQWAKTSNVKLLFDIKDADEALVEQLGSLFNRYDLYDAGIVCSFFPRIVYKVKRRHPRIPTGITWRRWFATYQDLDGKCPRFNGLYHYLAMLVDIVHVWSIQTWLPSFLGADMILTERSEITAEFVERQRRSGRSVCAWTVNDLNEITYMRDQLRIPLLTDKPFLLQKAATAA